MKATLLLAPKECLCNLMASDEMVDLDVRAFTALTPKLKLAAMINNIETLFM